MEPLEFGILAESDEQAVEIAEAILAYLSGE